MPNSVLKNWHSGRMPIVTRWFSASTFQEVSSRLSIGLPRRTPASEVPFSRRTFSSWCWCLGGWSGFYCRFCTLVPVVPETTLVSSRTLSFCFPLEAFFLSSINTTLTPAIRNHCPSFNSLISGVRVWKSEFLIYAALHHRFQHLIIRLSYLLMNLHVIQSWYGFELIRLTYSQFVQTFQDIILVGSWSQIIEFRPISYRSLEHLRYEEW